MKAETKRVAYEMEVEHEKKTTRLQERKKQLQGEMSLGVVPRLELGQLEKRVEAHNFLLDHLQTENASKTGNGIAVYNRLSCFHRNDNSGSLLGVLPRVGHVRRGVAFLC